MIPANTRNMATRFATTIKHVDGLLAGIVDSLDEDTNADYHV